MKRSAVVAVGVAACSVALMGSTCTFGRDRPCKTPELPISTGLTFMMGGDPSCLQNGSDLCANSPSADDDRAIPEHMVQLTPFYMDQTEVTNIQYRECVDEGECALPLDCVPGAPFVGVMSRLTPMAGCRFEIREYDDLPVVAVSWEDARAYCKWQGKDLPTEAQWERAAVGPRPAGQPARKFAWGDETDVTTRGGVVAETRCDPPLQDRPFSVRVDTRRNGQSAEGIYDLTGNVREWVLDDFVPSYYCDGPQSQSTPLRPDRFNDCSGTLIHACERSANAPTMGTVPNPMASGESGLKVVRGGGFCSTNISEVQHNCDLHTRHRAGMDADFITDQIPFPANLPGARRYAGVTNEAQVTGFRCVRNEAPPSLEDVCDTLPVQPTVYVPNPGGSSSSSSSSGGGGSSSSSGGMSSSGP